MFVFITWVLSTQRPGLRTVLPYLEQCRSDTIGKNTQPLNPSAPAGTVSCAARLGLFVSSLSL